MRRVVIASVVIALVAHTARAEDGKKFVSKEGKYAIAFPTGTKLDTQARQLARGVTLHTVYCQSAAGLFAAMHVDLPEVMADLPVKKLLDSGVNGLVQRGGNVLKEKDFEFGMNKFPARDLLVEKDGKKVRVLVVLAGLRLYTLGAAGSKDFATGKDATSFFDSFEITK